jgi:hypothetical protein
MSETQNPTISLVQAQIEESNAELQEILPLLGHSQAKRLLLAAMKYPMEETTFEEEDMIKAYSATKRITDGLVALGVETVIETMVHNHKEHMAQEQAPAETTQETENVAKE